MPKSVKVGVVGTSFYADFAHLTSFANHKQAELVAVCGRNRERAKEAAHKHNIPQVFTDYLGLITNGGVEAVVIATPDDWHHPITMAALEAGLHVLCEKPLALNLAHAQEMFNKAIEADIVHMVCLTARWFPMYLYAKQLIEDGYIGRLHHSEFSFVGNYGRTDSYIWRFDKSRANGILGDFGPHMLDLAAWLVGDITKVTGRLNSLQTRIGSEGQPIEAANDVAMLGMMFANGSHATVNLSAMADTGDRGLVQRVVLYGEAGTLEIDFSSFGCAVHGKRANEESIQNLTIPADLWTIVDESLPPYPKTFRSAFTRAADDFIAAILGEKRAFPTPQDFQDGVKAQAIIEAAIQSDQQDGRWLSIPQ